MADNVLRFNFLARDQASPTFDKLERKSDSLGSKLGKFGGLAATAFKAATVGAVGLGAAGVVMGVKTAAGLEQAQVGFTTLLGSGQKAQVFLTGLKKFAAATPFELPGLIESSRSLLGVGVSADQTMSILQDFGDAAGAVGVGQENFQRVIIATSQAMGAGRFMTADLNQITNNGIPIWTELARATGKPIPELRKMASEGRLLSKDVLPILHTQMQKDYGGAMAKQSKTLTGLWSNFSDVLSQGLAGAVQPMIPMLKTGLAGATKIAGDALKDLPGFVTNAKDAFHDWHLDDFGKRLAKEAKGWGSKLTSGMADGFSVGSMTKLAKDWGGLLFLGLETGFRTGDWSELGRILGNGLGKLFGTGVNLTSTISKAFASIDWFSIGAQVGLAALPFAIAFVANFGQNIVTVFKEHPMDFLIAITAFLGVGKIGGAIARILEHFPVLRWFAPLFRKVESVSKPFNNVIGKVLRFFTDSFSEGFLKAFPEIEGVLAKRLRGLADGIARQVGYLKDDTRKYIRGIISGVGEEAGNVTKSVLGVIRRMINPFSNAGQWLMGKGRDTVQGLMGGLRSRFGNLSDIISNSIDRVRRPFSRAGSWLYQAGREVLAGLRNGLYNGVQGAPTWAAHVGERIVSAVKHFFGIRSPSRVFGAIGSNLIHSLMDRMAEANPTQFIGKIFGGMPQALGSMVSKGLVHIENLPGKALRALSGLGGKFAGLLGFGGGSSTPTSGNAKLGQRMAGAYGWGSGSEWSALNSVVMRESGWRNTAQNPTSTAYGIFQFLDGTWGGLGYHKTSDPATQIAAGLKYIKTRYGDPLGALAHEHNYGWYGSGGVASSPRLIGVGEMGPERVLNATQTASFEKLVRVLDRGTSAAQSASGSSGDFDYTQLARAMVRSIAESGLSVNMDGRAVGAIQGRQANILSRTA